MARRISLVLLPCLVGLALLGMAGPAGADGTIDIPYTEVVEESNSPDGCNWFRYYLQINEVEGATSYSALNRYHGGGFTLNHTGPPFPDDDESGEGWHFTAPPGTHRWGATGGSGGGPCNAQGVKNEWEPDYVRAHFVDFKVTGEVKNLDGSPANGVTVTITGPESDTVTTGSDGTYSSKDFTTQGSYTVRMPARFCVVGAPPCAHERVLDLPPNGKVDFVEGEPDATIDAITFREPSVSTGELVDVGPGGTTDGNQVEVTAHVRNPQTFSQDVRLEFKDPFTGLTLPGGVESLTLPADGTAKVRRTIDTSGYAWLSLGEPVPEIHMRVSLDTTSTSSSKSERLGIRPKPLVLVHGLNADSSTYRAYAGTGFPGATHPGWRAYAVGDGQAPGRMDTDPFSTGMLSTRGNAAQVAAYVDGVRAATNAAHVDLLAHSLGGLISRRYVHEFMPNAADGKPVAAHLVMMGTPNLGSWCGDILSATFLAAGESKVGVEELTRTAATDFNRDVTNRKGVKFSGLVGSTDDDTCSVIDPGDGYVTVESAGWGLTDRATVPIWHTEMTSSAGAFAFVKSHVALNPAAATSAAYRAPRAARRGTARAAASRRSCATRSRKQVQLHASFIRTLKARGKATFAIPVTKAKRISVVMALPLSVRATLRDPSGRIRAKSAATAGKAEGSVRTLTVRKPRVGKWRVELVQTARRRAPVLVATVLAGSKERLVASAKRAKGRTLLVTATPLKGKRRVRGLRVTGRMGGSKRKARRLTLRDTGRKGDRKAGDGTYTARVRPLPSKDVRIAVSAKGKRFGLTTVTGYCAG